MPTQQTLYHTDSEAGIKYFANHYLPVDANTDIAAAFERLRTRWFLDEVALPIPRQHFRCPICHTADVQIRAWKFHVREASNHPYRCDVHFKCRECGLAWTHGILVPEPMFTRAIERQQTDHPFIIPYRDGAQWLQTRGELPTVGAKSGEFGNRPPDRG